jgi:hypothetical protein
MTRWAAEFVTDESGKPSTRDGAREHHRDGERKREREGDLEDPELEREFHESDRSVGGAEISDECGDEEGDEGHDECDACGDPGGGGRFGIERGRFVGLRGMRFHAARARRAASIMVEEIRA